MHLGIHYWIHLLGDFLKGSVCVRVHKWAIPLDGIYGLFFSIIASGLGVRYQGTGLELGLYSWAGILQYSQYSRITSYRPYLGLCLPLR